jgi:hypothetical protein
VADIVRKLACAFSSIKKATYSDRPENTDGVREPISFLMKFFPTEGLCGKRPKRFLAELSARKDKDCQVSYQAFPVASVFVPHFQLNRQLDFPGVNGHLWGGR